jgi:hypothetical protein
MLQFIAALHVSSKLAASAALTACCLAIPVAAGATGTIEIQHRDGAVNTYRDVEIKIFSGSLFLTSDDGDGTIVVTRAACSYREKIIVCLPTAAALVQEGRSNALNLRTGTIYLNYTNSEQPLSRSSAKLPANSVMLTLSTNNGTFINVRGRIDQLINR